MAGGQGGLIPKGAINDVEIITPTTPEQVQVHRNRAADGSGTYYGKLGDTGVEEIIGGPGAGSSGQLSVDVTYVSATRVLTATPAGAVGAVTYAWTIKSFTNVPTEVDGAYVGAVNLSTATLTAAAEGTTRVALAQVTVTDSIGRIAKGTFAVRDNTPAP